MNCLEIMKINSKDEELQNTQTAVKKKKKDKNKKDHINIDNQVKQTSSNKLKRNLSYEDSDVAKKCKTENNLNLLVDGANDSGCTIKFDKKALLKSQGDQEIKCLKSITENNNKNKENVENVIGPNEEVECLDGKFLRKSLNTANNLEILRTFVKLCKENKERDLAVEYLNAGGNILEVLKILDNADKKNISNAVTVFSVIRILLIKILAQYPQYHSNAEGACRHLINSHLSLIHSMLSIHSSAKQRKVVLQLLAVMVSLGGSLPRELLAHFSISPEVIKSLVQHTRPTDTQNIRNCFIHFVLAFLIEGNIEIIRTLLDKRNLLSSIFSDLVYDSKDIINLVITTLKTYILQNPSVTKTMKLHIFSTSVIQNIVYLYNWKGPNNWPKNKIQNFTSDPQYLEEKEVVTEIVHDFLIMLLTSYRHGIIFHDHMLGTSRIKHNNLVNTIIQSLDRPWEHEKPSDLVIKIMAACPDLIKSQFSILEPYIEPRVSTKWITAIKFIRKIISSVDVEACIKTCSSELNISQLANAIMSLTLPGVLLKHAIIPSLMHFNIIVRHEAILALLTIFNQVQKYLSIIKIVYNEDSDINTFKTCIIEFVMKHVPTLNVLLKVWTSASVSSSIETDNADKEYIPEPSKHEHLTAILNLLHAYNEVCPKLLDALPDVEPNMFLDVLNEVDNIDIVDFNAIKVKAIQFLIILSPTEFLPQKKIFKKALSFLISLLDEEPVPISSSVEVTIKTLLSTTGMFEGCDDHLDIWVKGFINLNNKKEVTKWFIHIIKKATMNIERYANDITEIEESITEELIRGGRLEDLFKELINKNNISENMENIVLRMQSLTSISPLLCCILDKMNGDLHPTILSYVSYVLIHTMHYQIAPQCLIHLAKNIELPVKEYLLSWLEGNDPICIKEIFPSMNLTCKLNSVLLSNRKLHINEIFSGNNTVTFQYNDKDIIIHHSLSAYDIVHLFKMTIFYLVQFTKRGSLTKIQNSNCKILLLSLLHIGKDSLNNSTLVEKCATFVFTHPIILHYFTPFQQNNKDNMKSMITLMVVDICNAITYLFHKCNVKHLFVHFKNKLMTLLCEMIDKRKRRDNINNVKTVTTLLKSLQLTSQDVVHLLKKLMSLESTMFIVNDEKNLSLYGYIVLKLLEIVNSDEMKSDRSVLLELDAKFVKCLYLHLLFLKLNLITSVEMWEISLYKYISEFPFNTVGIDTNMFIALLSTKITEATVKLISFLTSKNRKFIPIVTKYMMKSENIKDGCIVFPIIASNLNFKWNHDFLRNLKKCYETEILSYLRDPNDAHLWIEQNVTSISYLIECTFDFTTCSEICNSILQRGDKLDAVSVPYIKLLQSVYNKCGASEVDGEQFTMNWVHVLLHVTTLTLKKDSKNVQKLSVFCELLNNAIKNLASKRKDFMFETLSGNNSWSQYTRFSLKLGLKELKDNKKSMPILQTLSTLCNVAYMNDSDNEYVKTLFEMATSHSAFINIMLGSLDIKRDLIKLLWILMQKNKAVMALTHIPVYLAAYNATLSETDQYILFILQYYETNDINIYEYRPYLWGNVAAAHYSVKGEVHMNLWRQPSISQVLNLFEEDRVYNTIKNYPINRALKNNELYETKHTYDPAFYLPLLHFLLSENNIVSCHKVAQSGALALTFAACSSMHSDVRMLAYTIIARYYTHLEASSFKAKLLWMRLIDALRYGIASVRSELRNVRLNCLVSTFLARTSLVATQPLNPLYTPLHTFLVAKPALDINTIPELLQLFNSSDVKYKSHRCWILENIRDGMKTESELDVAFKCALFKIVLDFYTCNLSDSDTKVLILEVINVTLKITRAVILLVEGHGLVPWLLGITTNLYKQETRCVELIVKILNKLTNTIVNTKGDINQYKLMLLNIALNIKSYLSKDIKISVFILYINILEKLLESKSAKIMITKNLIIEILEFSKELLGNIDQCDDMLRFGCEYVTKVYSSSEDEISLAKNSLETLVRTWLMTK